MESWSVGELVAAESEVAVVVVVVVESAAVESWC